MAQRTDHAPSLQSLRDLRPIAELAGDLPPEGVQQAFDSGLVGISAEGEHLIKVRCKCCKEFLFLPATELSLVALRLASRMVHDDCA